MNIPQIETPEGHGYLMDLQSRLGVLETDNARLRAALDHYAAPRMWRPQWVRGKYVWVYASDERGDGVARVALNHGS